MMHCCVNKLAQRKPILNSSADLFHSPWRQQFAAFCLFVRTLPIDFALLGRKRKYIKIKTTAKLKAKRTSIATIWYLCRTYATFPTPLGSHYKLPLSKWGQIRPLPRVYGLKYKEVLLPIIQTRKTLDLDLTGAILIFDEAHNIQVGGFFYFFCILFNSASSAAPQIPLYRKDAGIEPRTAEILALAVIRYNHSARSHPLFFMNFLGGLEYVGHSFAYAYVDPFFKRDVWIRTQRAAVASRRATNLFTPSQITKPTLPIT